MICEYLLAADLPSIDSFKQSNWSTIPIQACPWEHPAFLQYLGINYAVRNSEIKITGDLYYLDDIIYKHPLFQGRKAGIDYPGLDPEEKYHLDPDIYFLIQMDQAISSGIAENYLDDIDSPLPDYALAMLAPTSLASIFVQGDIFIDDHTKIYVPYLTHSFILRAQKMWNLLLKYDSYNHANGPNTHYDFYMCQLAIITGNVYELVSYNLSYLKGLALVFGNKEMIKIIDQVKPKLALFPAVSMIQKSYDFNISASVGFSALIYLALEENLLLAYADILFGSGLLPINMNSVQQVGEGNQYPQVISSLDVYRYLQSIGNSKIKASDTLKHYLQQK